MTDRDRLIVTREQFWRALKQHQADAQACLHVLEALDDLIAMLVAAPEPPKEETT